MNERAMVVLSLFLLLGCLFNVGFDNTGVKASTTQPVHNVNTGLNYTSIQNAIDANETRDGHTISVDAGTYLEHIVVDKSLGIVGAGSSTTVIDGGGGGVVVHVVADNVLVQGFAIEHGLFGVFLDHSNNSMLVENNVTDVTDNYAIYASYSNSCAILQNIVGPNSCPGILVTNSFGFSVTNNHVHNNVGYGINANASLNGQISLNDAFENSYDGIGLGKGCRNCVITGNNVSGNGFFGVWLDSDSESNLIYDNNIINNGRQASVTLANSWDDGFEGNYWSDYTGVDQDHNGIGDTPLVIGENNIDNYPLVGRFSAFRTSVGYYVSVVSNSSIADFDYLEEDSTIKMRVINSTETQTHGFCRVQIPHLLMTEPDNVTVNGATPTYLNSTLHDDGYNRWIYFAYQHSELEVLIKGHPPPDTTPPTIVILSPEGGTYNVSDVQLTFTVNEPVSWMAFSLDSQDNVTVTGNTTITAGSDGSHNLVVYARDNAGNTGFSVIVYFTISAKRGEPFPPWVAATIVAIVVIAAVVLVYFGKFRRTRR